MIVQCPQCETRFNLPDEKVKPEGVKVRCSRCQHVFRAEPPSVENFDDLFPPDEPSAGEVFEPASTPGNRTGDVADEAWEASGDPADKSLSFSFPGLEKKAPPELAPDADTDAAAFEEPEQKPDKAPEHSLGLDLDEAEPRPAKKPGRGKKLLLVCIAVLFLLLGSLGAAYFLGLLPENLTRGLGLGGPALQSTEVASQPETPGAPPQADQSAQAPDAVSKIVLENVRQYTVANEKAGRLIVIEGKAVNNFPQTREYVAVEATLFDGAGKPLVTKSILCGNVLSYFQLQILSRDEINAALSAESGVLANNTNLEQGAVVPFMVVFVDPPAGVAEFGVKVTDSKAASGS